MRTSTYRLLLRLAKAPVAPVGLTRLRLAFLRLRGLAERTRAGYRLTPFGVEVLRLEWTFR